MCHIRMAFPKPLQYTDPDHALFLPEHYSNIWSASGLSPWETLPLAIFLWSGAQHIQIEGEILFKLLPNFQLCWSLWRLCSSIWTTIFFSFTAPHTCSKFAHGPKYLKHHLYCICLCLTEVSNIPCIWRWSMLHIAVPFPILQEGLAAAQSNPRAYDTSWVLEEPPTSPQHVCLVQQGVWQNCSALPERGCGSSPTSICCSILQLWFLPGLKGALSKLYGQKEECLMGFGKQNSFGIQEPSHSSYGKASGHHLTPGFLW